MDYNVTPTMRLYKLATPPMAPDSTDQNVKSYESIAFSFSRGLVRLWGAEAASARLMCALGAFHRSDNAGIDGSAKSILEHLAKIEYSSYESLAYVTDVSHLVYATSLLDTFLFDTTLFLFLLFPQAMGKNQQVPLSTLIDAASRNDAITKAAVARAREISYLPFVARVQFFRDKFGLAIEIEAKDCEALEHYPSIRNAAVHDQGLFDLALDDGGLIKAKRKACHIHPTPLTGDDVYNAIKVYERVARHIAEAVVTQILKQPDRSLENLRRASTRAQNTVSTKERPSR
jgi:hypothetical protein